MPLLIDGLIIVCYFVLIVVIGLYMGRRERSLHDFALGGRNVPWWAVMASIIAAETSAATFIGAPGEGFKAQSIVYGQLVIGLILGRIVVGYWFLKPYYTYRVYTVYDYLGVRFGERSKNYVAALFLVMRTLASGARVFVPALVMVVAWQALKSNGKVVFTQQGFGLAPYVVAILLITILTCLYTAVGGIKAVIWTDVIQATIMFGSAIVAIVTILYHIGGDSWNLSNGFHALGDVVPRMRTHEGYFLLGWEPSVVGPWKAQRGIDHMTAWEWVRLTLGSEFTLWSATIGAIFTNMAAFGTDQDMVQRLLTAETYQKSRRSLIAAAFVDLPIAAGFAFIGVLLVAYYRQQPTYRPSDNADVFGSYIINVMPLGVRGIVLAGVFATAMGSLSAALNALATSFTNDWYIPYLARGRSEHHYVGAARVFTAVFAMLMIVIAVGSAYVKVTNPDFRIIPFVIGIAGLFLGPMLGVFLIGMFTRERGSDGGNMLAITLGLAGIFFISGQHVEVANILHPVPRGQAPLYKLPVWFPVVKWPWFAMLGAFITLAVGMLFRTPAHALANARAKAEQARGGDERPMAMRGTVPVVGTAPAVAGEVTDVAGKRIALVAVSSVVPRVELEAGVGRLREAGFEVEPHPQCLERHFTYAGTDRQRADALWEAATGPADVVWLARGGYGAARVLPLLDELTSRFGPPPRKLLVGYSDVTVLHEYVRARWQWPTLHAPMPSAGNFGTYDAGHWRALIDLVNGRHPGRVWGERPLRWLNRPPVAPSVEAELVGGNLALWSSVAGTPYAPTPGRGRFVFFEDIGEKYYRIDRMLTQVRQGVLLDGAAAVILGDFTNCDDDAIQLVRGDGDAKVPLRRQFTFDEALAEIFGSLPLPVAVGLPVGHGPNFAPLPLGATYRVAGGGGV